MKNKFTDKNFIRIHFVYEQEKDKLIFKSIRNDIYYDSSESAPSGKNNERYSRLKNMRLEDTEAALQTTYKIVHYIHIFSGYKITSMIVEFMQDEYKNLWLSNCYYISSQKIEGMTEIEAIYLKRMSKFANSFSAVEARRKRSKTMIPSKETLNTQDKSPSLSPKLGFFRGMSVEDEKNNRKEKKIKFQNLTENNDKASSPSDTSEKNWRKKGANNDGFTLIGRASSILLNAKFNKPTSPIENKEEQKKIQKTAEINKLRSKKYFIIKPKETAEKPKVKDYIIKKGIKHKHKGNSVHLLSSVSLYYHGTFVKNSQSFIKLKEKTHEKKKRNKSSLPYLLYHDNS